MIDLSKINLKNLLVGVFLLFLLIQSMGWGFTPSFIDEDFYERETKHLLEIQKLEFENQSLKETIAERNQIILNYEKSISQDSAFVYNADRSQRDSLRAILNPRH